MDLCIKRLSSNERADKQLFHYEKTEYDRLPTRREMENIGRKDFLFHKISFHKTLILLQAYVKDLLCKHRFNPLLYCKQDGSVTFLSYFKGKMLLNLFRSHSVIYFQISFNCDKRVVVVFVRAAF
jgi:hypothetical protein